LSRYMTLLQPQQLKTFTQRLALRASAIMSPTMEWDLGMPVRTQMSELGLDLNDVNASVLDGRAKPKALEKRGDLGIKKV